MKSVPKVSIVTITYNQEEYIKQTLDSILMQKTYFDFEIVVADDYSNDNTPKIIQEYSKRYPDIFKLILRKKNIGAQRNSIDSLQSARGEYIALCEGDDFWTDPNKLQKQVDFMDKNPDYAICFHPVKVFFENNEKPDSIFPDNINGSKSTVEELLKENYIQTNSVMYRKQNYDNIPNNILPLDWYLHLYHARFGKIGFINRIMADYRRHPGGLWWSKDRNEFWQKHGIEHLNMYAEVLKLFRNNPEYTTIIYEPIGDAFRALAKLKQSTCANTLNEALRKFPDMAATSLGYAEHAMSNLEKVSSERQQRIDTLDVLVRDQQEHIEELEIHMKEMNETHQQIVNSKAWKTVEAIRAVRHPIHGAKSIKR